MHAERGTLSDLCALPAHYINLCLQVVGRQVAPVRFARACERSQLIRFSPKRLSLFESMQSQLSYSSLSSSLKPHCPTSWTVRTGAINAVLANYEVLCDALCKIHAGRDCTVQLGLCLIRFVPIS